MNIYKITFLSVEEEGYQATKKITAKSSANIHDKLMLSVDDKSYITHGKSFSDLEKYSVYGGGIKTVELIGSIPDALFSPTISEPDFVNNQIISKKNGYMIGNQG